MVNDMNKRPRPTGRIPTLSIPVYNGADFFVAHGANMGDSLSFAAELDLDDTYQMRTDAASRSLDLLSGENGHYTVAPTTDIGTPGSTVHLDCCLTVMAATGHTCEIVVLVEVDGNGHALNIFALPLVQIKPKTDYTLVGIETERVKEKFGQVACVSFTSGTHITMASGAQVPIEELRVGDRVLTRDDGPKAVRWIGQSTVRAVGDFAPIRIKAGALHNANDLLVSPDHRLFIYQRSDELGAGRHEVLVRARHLVNGDTVTRQTGGFVDYYQLLFDDHHIIFAEGIAAETFLVDTRTRHALPEELNKKFAQTLPGHEGRRHLDFEVSETLLKRPDTAILLRRSTKR
jgi:hypothetical protein